MINTVTNTAILNRSYSSSGLIVHGAPTNNVVRQTDGTLWAAVRERHLRGEINVYRSTDQGFTWDNVFKGSWPTGLGWGFEQSVVPSDKTAGPFMSLNIFEELDLIVVWASFLKTSEPEVRVWPFMFRLSDATQITEAPEAPPSNATFYQIAADTNHFKATYSDNMIFLTFIRDGAITLRAFYPNRLVIQKSEVATGSDLVLFDADAREDGKVDLVVLDDNESLFYYQYDDLDLSFSGSSVISLGHTDVRDINIVRDSYNVMMVAWSDEQDMYYATSNDNGMSWSVNPIPTTHGAYFDPVTEQYSSRLNAIAGINGFMVTYTRVKDGKPASFVRVITTTGIQDEKQIGVVSHPNRPVVGAKFFDTPSKRRMDLSAPGLMRVAYQVGEGNRDTGNDSKPVRFAQELLSESAYAIDPDIIFLPTVPSSGQILLKLKVIPGPSSNVDYYAEGAVGRRTTKSIAAFDKVGTPVRIFRYNPTYEAEVNDRSAYGAPEEVVVPAVITAMSYDAPFAPSRDDFTTYIERDARRIHIPPTLHLERQFILNRGNHLKRTVWTVLYGGNEYEITQVVPSFLHGQISHYSANMYVVGPSHDPFSRKILPSET